MKLEKFALEDSEAEDIEIIYNAMYLYRGLFLSGKTNHIYNYIKSKSEYKECFDLIVSKYFEDINGNFIIDFKKKEISRAKESLFKFEEIGS